jgi:hypothetical protein
MGAEGNLLVNARGVAALHLPEGKDTGLQEGSLPG